MWKAGLNVATVNSALFYTDIAVGMKVLFLTKGPLKQLPDGSRRCMSGEGWGWRVLNNGVCLSFHRVTVNRLKAVFKWWFWLCAWWVFYLFSSPLHALCEGLVVDFSATPCFGSILSPTMVGSYSATTIFLHLLKMEVTQAWNLLLKTRNVTTWWC